MAIIAPDVAPQPIPGFREQPAANETTFGGGPGLAEEGQNIQKVATQAGDIAALEMIRADQTAVEEAQAKALNLTQNVLYDPQSGILGSKGTNALQAQKDGIAKLQKGMNDLSMTLHGQQQVGEFNKWALQHVAATNRTVMGHVDQQLKEHDANMFNDLLAQSQGTVAMAHGNKDAVDLAFRTVNANAVNYAARSRMDPEQTKEFIQKANDKMHTAVIDGMLKFQPDESAQNYFDANKDNISPEAQKSIVDALQVKFVRVQAANAAQAILQKNPESEAAALGAADKIKNAEVQEEARKLISSTFSQNRQAQKNDQDALFMKWNTMVNQKGLTDPLDRKNAVNIMDWNRMSAEQQRAIERGGQPDETSMRTWLDFREKVADGSITKLTRADLESKYLPYMSPGDQKTAVDKWSAAQKGANNPKLIDSQTTEQSISTSLITAGLLPAQAKKMSNSDTMLLKQVDDQVHRDIVNFESSQNRPPKPDEKQAIIDKRTVDALGSRPQGFFSRFKTPPAVPYEMIPEGVKEHVIQLARDTGGFATRAKIEKAYAMHRQGSSDEEIAKTLK